MVRNRSLPHVLIIEDDEGFAYALEQYLAAHSLRVTVARSGMQALQADDRDPADVVVLDVKLPDMNGGQVMLDFKARRPKVPVVVVSAYPQEMSWVSSTDILRKPVDPEAVYVRLCPLLNSLPV